MNGESKELSEVYFEASNERRKLRRRDHIYGEY